MTSENVQPLDSDREGNAPARGRSNAVPVQMSAFKKSLIWLAVLAFFSLVIVGLGMHIGANGEGKWYTDAVVWLVTKLK